MKEKPQNLIPIEKIGEKIDDKFQEWKKFAFANRTIETAAAFTLGVAFSKVVSSISEGLVMPFIHYFGSYTGHTWREWTWEPLANLKLEMGKLYAAGADFLLISVVLFVIWKIFIQIGQTQEVTLWKRFCRAIRWVFSWRIKFEKVSKPSGGFSGYSGDPPEKWPPGGSKPV